MSDELLKQVVTSLREFRTEVNGQLTNQSAQIANIDKQQVAQGKDIEFMKQEDLRQNKLLEEHIEGVKQVREQNTLMKESLLTTFQSKATELEKRIKKLEGPGQWLKQTLWIIATAGAVAYALYHINLLLHILPK